MLLIFILIVNVLLGLVLSRGKKEKKGKKNSGRFAGAFMYKIKSDRIGKVASYVCAFVTVIALFSIIAFVVVSGLPHLSFQLLFGEYVVAGAISIRPA